MFSGVLKRNEVVTVEAIGDLALSVFIPIEEDTLKTSVISYTVLLLVSTLFTLIRLCMRSLVALHNSILALHRSIMSPSPTLIMMNIRGIVHDNIHPHQLSRLLILVIILSFLPNNHNLGLGFLILVSLIIFLLILFYSLSLLTPTPTTCHFG